MITLEKAHMVIVGSGHCGGRAAQALRELGWVGGIHLVGDEVYAPYERSPLSKDLLTGEKLAQDCALWSERAMSDLAITRHTDRVVSINPVSCSIALSNQHTLTYQSLLLATGGKVRKLTIAGGDLPEVMTLRGLDDGACSARTCRGASTGFASRKRCSGLVGRESTFHCCCGKWFTGDAF